MLDRWMRPLIDPPLNRLGRSLARAGLHANSITLLGLALGLVAAGLIGFGQMTAALVLLLASRVADGLDGAVARATTPTDFGGYLDICADFLFYGAIPMGFALLAPDTNAVAAAFLLLSFYVNGASFLGYAILAEKHGLKTSTRGKKSLYFTGGLLEGTETIGFFCLICLWPSAFAPLAWGFGTLCLVTATSRIVLARQVFDAHTKD